MAAPTHNRHSHRFHRFHRLALPRLASPRPRRLYSCRRVPRRDSALTPCREQCGIAWADRGSSQLLGSPSADPPFHLLTQLLMDLEIAMQRSHVEPVSPIPANREGPPASVPLRVLVATRVASRKSLGRTPNPLPSSPSAIAERVARDGRHPPAAPPSLSRAGKGGGGDIRPAASPPFVRPDSGLPV
ncbi:hypothetical protein DCS_07600 [Drechmeria coniospora]|uniref:Uncharacterized protein n=1 Tax=Drechmeria coniospora TaxID=98403 RepID=A0A151GEW2_DRECN|nr:hypothetical protein DCS_07600 [Drechmeria coniospora]KYK55637.1 hypothetical protein DCS_07600 [Drechmeria coniospora]